MADHPLERGSNQPALWNLDKAYEQFGDQWSYYSLSLTEILDVVLCHHDHWMEPSNVQLIQNEGLTVAQAMDRYRSLQDYETTNPTCWQTIEHVKASISDVYLSRRPLDTDDFRPLERFDPPHLFVLDGLHRLIAWGLAGNYSEQKLKAKPVNAFIADG